MSTKMSVYSPSYGVRRGVQIVTSLLLTAQIFSLAATVVLYLYANRPETRDTLARAIITTLYHREDWRWMRRGGSLQFHILVSLAVQLLLALPTALLLAGAARRVRFLLLPWLVVFGALQVFLVAAIVLCVVSLPERAKVLAAAVTAAEAFVVFPWWFSVLHLFALLGREEEESESERLSYLVRSSASAIAPNSAAHSWSYGGDPSARHHQHHYHQHHNGRSSSTTKLSEI